MKPVPRIATGMPTSLPFRPLEVGSVVGDTMRLRQCSENDSLVRPLWTVWRILSTEESPIAFGRSVLRHVPTEGYRAPFCGVLGFEFWVLSFA